MDAMTTLMVLMAGLTLGSDRSEGISTKAEQRLCIEGKWKGSYQGTCPGWLGLEDAVFPIVIQRGAVSIEKPPQLVLPATLLLLGDWIDEGKGRFRIDFDGFETQFHGIYRREAGCLIICMTAPNIPRPTAFTADGEHALLFLKPAMK
jgi:hypothetical protein